MIFTRYLATSSVVANPFGRADRTACTCDCGTWLPIPTFMWYFSESFITPLFGGHMLFN